MTLGSSRKLSNLTTTLDWKPTWERLQTLVEKWRPTLPHCQCFIIVFWKSTNIKTSHCASVSPIHFVRIRFVYQDEVCLRERCRVIMAVGFTRTFDGWIGGWLTIEICTHVCEWHTLINIFRVVFINQSPFFNGDMQYLRNNENGIMTS